MIIVIADDITGAAELGGIALRYGLRVLLSHDVNPSSDAEVLIVYTNTRSLQKEKAVEVMTGLTRKAKELKPSLFYKKTDSVLRGHVLAEMEAQMEVLSLEKALLIPANPLLGRTIKKGQYFLKGQPIHEGDFATDPEFPIHSSRIEDLLGTGKTSVHVISKKEALPTGVSVGDAETDKDITAWTNFQHEPVLLAGAASFFAALLNTKFPIIKKHNDLKLSTPILLVSGTTYQKNVDRRKDLQHLVSYMPSSLLSKTTIDQKNIDKWANETLGILATYGNAMITIGKNEDLTKEPRLLKEKLAAVVNRIMDQTEIKELLIEGGSTAFSIIQELGLSSFTPTEELSQGVVRMKAEGEEPLHLTIKPGSYDWPQEWHFK